MRLAADGNMSINEGDVIYRIDGDDVLVGINDQWDVFAVQNNSPQVMRERVINHNLWTYITDPETRHVHKTLVQRVRRRKAILNLPFRCDAPTLRRYMEMDLLPLERGGVEYHCRLIRTESRPPVALQSPEQPARQELIRMCSWCKKVEVAGRWVEIEEAVRSWKLLERDPPPPITHAICKACLVDLGIDED